MQVSIVLIVEILLLIVAIGGMLFFLRPKSRSYIVLCVISGLTFAVLSLQAAYTLVRVTDNVRITALKKTNGISMAEEVDIVSVQVDRRFIKIYDAVEGTWYQVNGNYSWRGPWDSRWDGTATDTIVLKIPVGWNRSIHFLSNDWKGFVEIQKPDGSEKQIDTYSSVSSITSYSIGRSDIRLLLLQGVLTIAVYAVILGSLTVAFAFTAKNLTANQKRETKQKAQKAAPDVSKKQWGVSFLLLGGLSAVMALFVCANLWGRVVTMAPILTERIEFASQPITVSDNFEQTFHAVGTFNCIRLYFAVYNRENEQNTTVNLLDGTSEELIQSWIFDNRTMAEGPVNLEMDEARGKGDYILKVSSNNINAETSIGVFLQSKGRYSGNLSIRGEIQSTDIGIGLYQKTNLGYIRLIAVLAASVVLVWIAYLLLFIFKIELWKAAFSLIVGFGCVYLFIIPGGCSCDPWAHYATIYKYSNQLLGEFPVTSMSGKVMMRMDDCEEYFRYWNIINDLGQGSYLNPRTSIYYEEFDEFSLWCRNDALQDSGATFLGPGNWFAYSPLIFGLSIGRLLSIGTIPCMLLARVVQLIVVAALVSLSIKIIPTGKEILLLIALLPIFQQQITAFSYDGLAFAFAFLFIAFCVKLQYQADALSFTNYVLLMCAAAGMCACRGGMYVFLLSILLLIPRKVLTIKQKVFVSGIGIISLLSFFGQVYFSESSGLGNGALNLGAPLQHPIRVMLLFVSSIIENIGTYWEGAFGTLMGATEAVIPSYLAFVFTLLIIIVSLPDKSGDNNTIGAKSRILYAVVPFLTLVFCLAAMYMGENSRATEWNIWGVQGRYFIPVLPLIFFQVQNRSIVLKKNTRPAAILVFCVCSVLEVFYLMRCYLTR